MKCWEIGCLRRLPLLLSNEHLAEFFRGRHEAHEEKWVLTWEMICWLLKGFWRRESLNSLNNCVTNVDRLFHFQALLRPSFPYCFFFFFLQERGSSSPLYLILSFSWQCTDSDERKMQQLSTSCKQCISIACRGDTHRVAVSFNINCIILDQEEWKSSQAVALSQRQKCDERRIFLLPDER